MEQKNNIDKQIYGLASGIGRRFLPLYGGYACTLFGGIAAALYFGIGSIAQHQTASELLLVCMTVGAIALLIVISFYLIGDCRRPYYRPDGSLIERKELFFDNFQRDTIIRMVQAGDIDGLDNLPKSIQANMIVISYCDPAQHILALQAFENNADALIPVTDIFFNQKTTR